jgi:peptide/nickel transport system substrate-binding protein
MADSDRQFPTARGAIDRRTFVRGVGAAAGALGLGAAGIRPTMVRAQGTPAPTAGGTLRIAFGDALTKDGMNPTLSQDNFYIVPPQSTMYESLVRLDNDFQPNPHLAESWESSDDAQTWTFKLRQGVEFHDGSTMTAKDVVYSLQKSMDPQSGTTFYAQLKDLLKPENITAVDDATVQFKLESPFVFFANPLGTRNARVVKDGATPEQLASAPNGTGPFRYESFVAGETFAANRFENYWQEGKPYLDRIEIKNIPESASKLQALLTGDVDLIDNIEYASSKALEGTDYEALPLKDGAWHGVICDVRVDPFTEPRVIKAMKMAFDRQQVADVVYAGFGSVAADSVIPLSDPYFPADLQPQQRDIDGAKALLAEAGYANGLEIPHPLLTVFGFGTNNLAAVLKEQLAEIGVTITIQEAGPTFWDTVWMKQPFYIPDFNRRHPSEIFPLISITDAGQWMTHWSNPDFDAAVKAAAQTTDFDVQKENYGKAITLQSENDGILLPAYAPRLHAKAKTLQGVWPNFVSFFDFTDAYFQQ